jgi:hypothetical protein
MTDKSRQPFKADRNLAQLAQAAAATGVGINTVFGGQGLVATGSIPNPTNSAAPVVVAFVAVTPKFSGKYEVEGSIITGTNQNGGTQAIRATIETTTTLPVLGAAPVTPAVQAVTPDIDVGTAMSAAVPITSTIATLTPIGTQQWICLCVAQSVAGAFATAATLAAGIRATETLNG